MRVLVLGATGMLGHKVWQVFQGEFDTYAGVRQGHEACAKFCLFDGNKLEANLDACNFSGFPQAFARVKPEVVINCVGIIKQLSGETRPSDFIEVNSMFPHKLAELCSLYEARLVHLSTDCVYSGRKGMYTERDTPDPEDIYGQTKLLGEVIGEDCLTIRTSMIGRELQRQTGLLEWFFSQEGRSIQGYTGAIFSGLTTASLARVLMRIITDHMELTGLYHVSSKAISKYDLLLRLKEAYQLKVEIEPIGEYCVDRSLDSSQFRHATGITIPTWDKMIHELISDTTPYNEWRS
jgi:dTDP-4-dehydrorhamnose reductase